MAHLINFNGGSASITSWSANGAFSVAFKTVYVSNNDLTVGNTEDSAQYFGAVNGGFRIAIGSGYSPGFSIANGDLVEGTIVRDASNNLTLTLNGQQFTTTLSGTFTINKIGGNGNSTYETTSENFYYLTLDNNQGGIRDYTPDASGIPGATLSGSYTVVEYGVDPEVDSITISNPLNINQPYPIISGNGVASFNITYSGTPTALEYELSDADTSEVIQPYSVFDNSPSGGESTLTINTPATQRRYLVSVRFANDPTVESEQTSPWLTAHVIELAGQSLIEHLGRDDDSLTPAGVYKYNTTNGIFQSSVGRGQAELGKVIADATGYSVVIANTAVGGTCMTNHCAVERGDGSNYWANASSSLSTAMMDSLSNLAPDGVIYRLAFGQGQTDAVVGSPPEDYLAGLNAVIDRVRDAATEADGSELPVIVGLLGRNTSTGNDVSAQEIREKQLEYLDSDPNATGVLMYTYGTDDGTHPNDAGDVALGKALAYAMLGYKPPKVTGISANNALTEITLTFDKDLKNDATYSTEGVRVNSGGVEQTVSSFTRAGARTAVITLSQAIPITNNVDVYVGYGTGSTSTLLTYPSAGDGSELVMIPLAENAYDLGVNQPPTANAGFDQSIAAGVEFILDGTGSQDTDGTIVEYRWTQIAGDPVILDISTPSQPKATSPSRTSAQTLTFQLITVDDEGEESAPGTVNVNVAAVVLSEILKVIERLDFDLVTQGDINAYFGRANREVMKLKPSDPTGLALDANGFMMLDSNTIEEVKVIAEGNSISSKTDSINLNGSEMLVRLGDLEASKNGNIYFSIVVFVEGDTKGVVVSSKGSSGNKPMSYVTL